MESHKFRYTSNARRLFVLIGLLFWLGIVLIWAHRVQATSVQLTLAGIRNRSILLGWLWTVVSDLLMRFAMFVPVGILAVLALPGQERFVDRVVRRWLPAFASSLLLSYVVLGFSAIVRFAAPGALFLLLPWTGCLVGCWAGMAFSRGGAHWLFFPELALIGTFAAVGAAVVFYLAIESQPLQLDTPSITSAEKRRLYGLFSGKNPLKLEEGRTVQVSLTEQDINLLLAWGLSVGRSERKARVTLEDNRVQLQATTPIPGSATYLNVLAWGHIELAANNLNVRVERARIGRVEIPKSLLRVLSRVVSSAATDDERVKSVLQVVKRLDADSQAVTVSYGHGAPPKGFIASLFHDPIAVQIDSAAIEEQILNLLATLKKTPASNDDRFGLAAQTAFRMARGRSATNSAVQENRNAVLALGIALGHYRVESLLGKFLDDSTRESVKEAFRGTTLRKRDDWTKHFFVSAALTVIAAGNVSDATGLFKEEKDAGGGSGFSFGDLLADRSGTTFAQVATRDEASARALQDRLARGYNVDDYFPPGQDLPENLQDADFQARYGGVGGAGYRRLRTEIERRIARCSAYTNR
jgi:hypothetical protein